MVSFWSLRVLFGSLLASLWLPRASLRSLWRLLGSFKQTSKKQTQAQANTSKHKQTPALGQGRAELPSGSFRKVTGAFEP